MINYTSGFVYSCTNFWLGKPYMPDRDRPIGYIANRNNEKMIGQTVLYLNQCLQK